MNFTPEVEDEVILYAVSHKLDINLVNAPNKVWRDSTQTRTPTSPFQIGDSLIYTNQRYHEIVDLVDLYTTDPDITK